MADDVVLRLDALQKSFGGTPVIRDLTLSVLRGEFLTLLGPSGCGKTTTLRIIAGLATPDAGRVFLDGRDVTDLAPNRRDVNTVFQNYALFPHMNVERNIAYGLKLRGVDRAQRRARVADMLELVRLPGFEARMPGELSGGQRQRVAIARAIVLRPRMLLLDEPLGALDLKLRQQMQTELKQMQSQLGITFLYITHDQEEALNMSDRIAIMREGRIEQIGTPEDIYERPRTRFASRFIGQGAVLEGEVESLLGGNVCRVALCAGRALASFSRPVSPGQRVAVSVHAERVRYASEEQPGFSIRATVRSHRYAGSVLTTELLLADGQTLIARGDSAISDLPGVGADVYVYWRASHGALIDEEALS